MCVLTLTAVAAALAPACSKAEPVDEDPPVKSDGGSSSGDGGGVSVQQPGPAVPGSDSGTSSTDAAAPAFDLTKVASIQGTFVTEQTGLNGVNSAATVNWSFKIDAFGDVTQASTTARWNNQATSVTGGNAADFPADTNLTLQVTHPSAGTWEFYDNEVSPYVYILVKIADGSIKELYYYRRLLDDSETNPPDLPKNLKYTVTTK